MYTTRLAGNAVVEYGPCALVLSIAEKRGAGKFEVHYLTYILRIDL